MEISSSYKQNSITENNFIQQNNRNILKNKAMKTKNNVQKTIQRMSVIFTLALLIACSAAASETRGKTTLTVKTNSKVHFQVPAQLHDAGLKLESWMTDESNFPVCKAMADKTEKTEMTNNNSLQLALIASSAADQPLRLQPWMTDYALWNNGK
jgi:hypothetical protein